MTVRLLHVRRYADVMMGSIINGAKTKVQKLALRKGIELAKGQTEFNEKLRDNSPSLYLVDPDLIAAVVFEKITQQSKTFVSAVFTDEGPSSIENSTFETDLANALSNNPGLQKAMALKIRERINADFNSSRITTKELTDTVKSIYDAMISDMEKAEKTGKSYVSYQIAAAKAGAELRRILNLKKVSILEDGHLVVQNLGDRIPFVSYTFSTGVSTINKSIQQAVDEILDLAGIQKSAALVVGNLVHAGHVGIYKDDGLLGINMPAATIGGLISGRFTEIENAIGNIPIHIEQGIRLATDYTKNAGMFLDLQFNFAVSMEGSFNSGILGPQEVAAVKAIVSNVANKALEEAIKEQISAESISKVADILQASPSYIEYLEQAVRAALEGKTLGPLKHEVNPKLRQALDFTGTAKTSKSKGPQKAKALAKTKPPVTAVVQKPVSSLLTLQGLLNSLLTSTIAKNMGEGNRRDILNYRTGRFAGSVKVERLSQSRGGMITAFYSYMKNPYATFSQGGNQEFPRSRDPKLLISKSIREIAAEKVANRLRAVAV